MAVIDFHALGQVIWVSLVAGIGVTVLFSVVIWGADKAEHARRGGHDGHGAGLWRARRRGDGRSSPPP